MSPWQQWQPRLRQEKQLLIELALMVLMALVVGVYFLEHFSSRLEAQQRDQLHALAEQTALRAAESLAGNDLIGLNVIARETQALKPVAGVHFLDTARKTVTGNDDDGEHGVIVEVPVALPDGELAGSVVLSASASGGARHTLETGYVLVVIGLLVLRIAAALIERRLRRPRIETPIGPAEADGQRSDGDPHPVAGALHSKPAPRVSVGPVSELRLSVVNFDHFQQRYTRGALQALLSDYQALLEQVAGLYGGTVVEGIGARCRVQFAGEPLSQSAFAALCAGLLFLRVARLQGPRRKARSAPALEFKALVSSQFTERESWALCVAGVPGRMQVPDSELTRAELDVKALYQTEKAMVVSAADRQVRLQPVEQLAYRYQTLLRTQAERVMGAGSGEDTPPGQ